MSLIFTDGFDHTASFQKWTFSTSTDYQIGRTGTQSARLLSSFGVLRKQVSASDEHATFIIGGAFKRSSSTAEGSVQFQSDSGATVHAYMKFNADGSISAYSVGTLRGTSATGLMPSSAWMSVEMKVVLHDSAGSITIRVNGVQVLNVTGIDTKNGGTKSVFDTIYLSSLAGSQDIYVDDLYLCNGAGSTNNDFLGDIKIETLYASGAGATTGLTPSAGSNYQCVDEATPNTTDYNGSDTADLYDTYAFGDLTTTTGTVYGVNVFAYAAKSDAGAKSGAIVVRAGGTDYEQDTFGLSTSYLYYNKVLETNPNTTAAWTIANVNSAEFGFKVKA